jgi:hemerythrin
VEHEDEWIGQELDRLDSEIPQGKLGQAAETCQRLLANLEVHFAFEELVMTRIAFPWAYGHQADHVELLVGMARLLQEIHGVASDPQNEQRGERMREQLCNIEHDLRIHAMRRDRPLRRYVAHTVGMIAG